MSTVVLLVPGALRPYAGGSPTVEVDSDNVHTIRDLLTQVEIAHPALGRRIRDERGAVRRHVNVYVNGADIRRAQQLDTPVAPGAEVLVVPAVSGG